MATIGEEIQKALEKGKGKGLLAVDLRMLIRKNEGFKEQIDVFLARDKTMQHVELFHKQVERLLEGEPVEQILGECEFLSHHLKITGDVLIPRSETEELVALISEEVPKYYDPRNYLVCCDIGTGSGAIAIALKSLFPNWLFTATDISEKALKVAKENAENAHLSISFKKGDALDPIIDSNMALDILVSNPPYVMSKDEAQQSVVDYEPAEALFFSYNNNVYEKVFRNLSKVKKGPIFLAFEIDPQLESYLDSLMEKYLTSYQKSYHKDMNGFTRFLLIYVYE